MCPSIFFILFEYRDLAYILIYLMKNYHKHYYGFENLMSCWGAWFLFSKIIYGKRGFNFHTNIERGFKLIDADYFFFLLNFMTSWGIRVWFIHANTGLFELAG